MTVFINSPFIASLAKFFPVSSPTYLTASWIACFIDSFKICFPAYLASCLNTYLPVEMAISEIP